MDEVPDPNSYIREINGFLCKELIHILDTNDVWKKVAAEFNIFDWKDLREMERKSSPSEALLAELDIRNCTVRHLCTVLSTCQLTEPLALLSEPEPLKIMVQPGDDDENDMFIPFGHQLRLEVVATGVPPPQYLWFRDNEELDQRNSLLIVQDFMPEHSGEYRCLVSQEGCHEEFSRPVYVRMLPEPPVIQVQPSPVSVHEGEEIVLKCEATGYPAPVYEWLHGNMILIGENKSTLRIEHALLSHGGIYKCRVSNECDELDSDRVKISVFPQPTNVSFEKRPQLIVEEKVALLIANDSYENLDSLHTPRNDVKTLASLLTKLGFKVIALCNLTLMEMTNAVNTFCKMLPEGAYAFFYFAGHGFKLHDKYMLPVDCPDPTKYRRSDSVCECFVLHEVLERKPLLFVLLLDMCLKVPGREENPSVFSEQVDPIPYNPNRNLIQGYATTCNLGAYERRSETNGIYVKHLQKYLMEDRPFIRILEDVIDSISKEAQDAVSLQMPSHGHNVVCDMHYLTVPAKENPETKMLFDGITTLQSDSVIFFKETKVPVKFQLYKECFHNALEMHLPLLNKYRVGIHSQYKELQMSLDVEKKDIATTVVTIFNLQKLKITSLSLSVMLYDRANGQLVDNAIVDVGSLPITTADLWFDCPISNL